MIVRHELKARHGKLYLVYPHLYELAEIIGSPLVRRYVLAHGLVCDAEAVIHYLSVEKIGTFQHFVDKVFLVKSVKLALHIVVKALFSEEAHCLLGNEEQPEDDADSGGKLTADPECGEKEQHKSQ